VSGCGGSKEQASWATHGRSTRTVDADGGTGHAILRCLSVWATRDLFSLLEMSVRLFESGPGESRSGHTHIAVYEVELRERLNPVTPWLTILNVRARRHIDAETKSSFPATLAGTESKQILDNHSNFVHA
jgi:hypothetical protein